MKKIFTLCMLMMCGILAHAQINPNRILIHESTGNHKGFLVERVDSVTFVQQEGEIKADIEVVKVELEKITVSVKRTPDCVGFKLSVVPELFAKKLTTDAVWADYLSNTTGDIYQQDFTSGELTGVPVEPNSNYVIATVGYDKYAIPCSVSKATFTTPSKALVGDPKVEAEVLDVQLTEFTLGFTPNKDVKGYAVMAGEMKTLQQQYEMFSAMFGFHNMGDMVKAFGVKYETADEFTWAGMDPNTEYAVLIQAWDVEETCAPIQQMTVATLSQGGTGEAVVNIKLGEYKLQDWDGQKLPSQFISYEMNDQTWCYRVGTYLAHIYDKDAENIEKDLKSEPDMPTAGWFLFEDLSTDYQIDPNTDVVALAAAKNADGVWGKTTILRFTTPDKANMPAHKNMGQMIMKRTLKHVQAQMQAGKMPVLKINSQKGMQLIEK